MTVKAYARSLQWQYACSIAAIGAPLLVTYGSTDDSVFRYYEQAMRHCLSWLREEGVQ